MSKIAILKCPSVTSRRAHLARDIKIDFFQEMLDPLLKYAVFYVLMTHDVVFSLLDGY